MWKFARKVFETWGLKQWQGIDDTEEVLFFGMYSDNDYEVFRHYKGRRSVFWAGSDIIQMLRSNERTRVMKLHSPETKHYTEMEQEGEELRSLGLDVTVSPSFLEDINNFPVCFKPSKHPQVYLSGHPNREEEYGFDLVKSIAPKLPEITFHFYGVEGKSYDNIVYHGWVPDEQFNQEIRNYHCGLRCNLHDGCSEIVIKSILLGQYPIARLPYPSGVQQYETEAELVSLLSALKDKKSPSEGRDYWLKVINDYPWMKKEDAPIDHPHRIILLEKIKELYPFDSVMEIGCGVANNLLLFKKEFPKIKVAGLDKNKPKIDKAKSVLKADFKVGMADSLPFEDKSFDIVLTDQTLIYVPPETIEKVKSEMLRVARKAIVMVEFHSGELTELGYTAFNHWARNYKKLFKDYEVELTKITNWGAENWDTVGYIIKIKL